MIVAPLMIQAQNLGIGTTTPTTKLHVHLEGTTGYTGGILLQAPNMTTGSQTVFSMGKNTTFGNMAELRFNYDGPSSSGNRYEFGFSNIQPFVSFTAAQYVGIGTMFPASKLHVVGQLRLQDGTQGAGKVLTSDANGLTSWQIPSAGAETDPQVSSTTSNVIPKWNGTSLVDGTITDNGTNVGIGTTSPSARLHVFAPGTSGFVGGMYLEAPNMLAGSTTAFAFGKNSSFVGNQGEMRYSWTGNSSEDNRIEFGFNSLQPFVAFTSGERVGIGTMTPSNKLHVVGQVRIQDGSQGAGKVLTSDANGVTSWQTPSAGTETDPEVSMAVNNCIPKWNGTALTDGLITDNGTNVGIGNMSPAYKLTIGGGNGVFAVDNTGTFVAKNSSGVYENYFWPRWEDDRMIMNYGDGGFEIRNNASSVKMKMLSNGNVGIGTSDPESVLHVAGSMRIVNGTQAAGKVLTSDANGVASWQTPTAGAETDPQVASTINNQIPKWNGTALADGLITDSGSNIGIGTTSPASKLHVQVDGVNGYTGGILLQAPNMATGSQAVLIMGKNNGTNNQAELRFNYDGANSTNNRYEFGFANTQPAVFMNAAGRMGIGVFNPGGQLELSLDQGRKPSTSTWTITSDARVKNIDGQYTKGLNEIVQLNPIVYHYKNTREKTFSADVLAAQNVGLTAQEAQQVFPEAVGVDPDGTLNLNMHSIFVAGINAIKELNTKVEEQQAVIDNQQQQINELMAKLNLVLNQMTAVSNQ